MCVMGRISPAGRQPGHSRVPVFVAPLPSPAVVLTMLPIDCSDIVVVVVVVLDGACNDMLEEHLPTKR